MSLKHKIELDNIKINKENLFSNAFKIKFDFWKIIFINLCILLTSNILG